jgi:hypothetical protein
MLKFKHTLEYSHDNKIVEWWPIILVFLCVGVTLLLKADNMLHKLLNHLKLEVLLESHVIGPID